ncbi:hypothetical protein VTH06DRAFT_1825 [Thermothelomyces fergusii]
MSRGMLVGRLFTSLSCRNSYRGRRPAYCIPPLRKLGGLRVALLKRHSSQHVWQKSAFSFSPTWHRKGSTTRGEVTSEGPE